MRVQIPEPASTALTICRRTTPNEDGTVTKNKTDKLRFEPEKTADGCIIQMSLVQCLYRMYSYYSPHNMANYIIQYVQTEYMYIPGK